MKHLTDDQLAEWLAGAGSEETLSHLEACPLCHGESLALRDGISRYSLTRREQARSAQWTHLAKNFAPQKRLVAHRLRWAGAAALALVLAAPTAWMLRPQPAPAPPAPGVSVNGASASSTAMSDDELLEAVNNDLSRDVPQALAPVSAITVARNKIAASTGTAKDSNAGK